ncbi:MAG: imidazole glycerol phosphate synthase subunit HisH [Verrucomicrobia bacterium TMED56]|nr:MAG: imidazole glycerol phosphate synthase subunit HisH [Verrucomicrobia bacterium TMED56]|tara:strand:+ start:3021 stop:3623 length:603 start_codon:yes stop_codon:yes gene_type:complete
MRKNILIFDYGLGNYSSIEKTLKRFDTNVLVGNSNKLINNSEIIILPGVGTFPQAMKQMKKKLIIKRLKLTASSGKNILGICLGMQLFTEFSPEIEDTEGLKFIKGKTKKIPFNNHVGWNEVFFQKNSVFECLNKKNFYFQHQYFIDSKISAEKGFFKINNKKFIAMIKRKNILGVQFHPEKSQNAGLDFFKLYLESLND